MEFKNKVAVITGGCSGIGYALTKELIAEGMKVYSICRRKPATEVAGVIYLSADVSDEGQLIAALAEVKEPVDLLVNNAGKMKRANYWELSDEDFEMVWSVDVKGNWLMFKHLRDRLSKGAMTVQTNSKNSLQLKADTFAYTLSKLADLDIDKLVAKDRVDLDMRVVHLGPVDTPLEWTDYSSEQKAEKLKIAITPADAAKLMMDLIKSDKKTLLYNEEAHSYTMI